MKLLQQATAGISTASPSRFNADGKHGLTLLVPFTLAELRGSRPSLLVTFLP